MTFWDRYALDFQLQALAEDIVAKAAAVSVDLQSFKVLSRGSDRTFTNAFAAALAHGADRAAHREDRDGFADSIATIAPYVAEAARRGISLAVDE